LSRYSDKRRVSIEGGRNQLDLGNGLLKISLSKQERDIDERRDVFEVLVPRLHSKCHHGLAM
jgi:hypothetical protein